MSSRKKAFTLVEILIVVIILGILAAVVIPQFSEASSDTRASSVMSDLKMIRSQIQLYKAQHSESYPDAFANQMTKYTDVDGTTATAYTSTYRFGPYMLKVPPNPYTGDNTVRTVTTGTFAAPTTSAGWYYNSGTGEFRADNKATDKTPSGDVINTL
ncbi:MAG: prepilin-type N-terminal cleavage/methylation domain-containing protein [Anaerolineaceae bacterium]|nr:prepilin-type N-terminal cleavage/methylation domain-containing protein [Anaerolineaceae bacterium]